MNTRLFKWLLATVVTVLLIGFDAHAEDGHKKNGIRAGYQSANILKENGDEFDPRSGFYIGYYRVTKIVPLLSFQSGLEYIQCGATGDLDSEVRLNYLSIPLSARLKLGPVFVLGGVNANFKIVEELEVAGVEVDINADNESPFMDVPVHVGVGVNFLFLCAEARYHYGLVELNDGYHNSYLQVGLGLHF